MDMCMEVFGEKKDNEEKYDVTILYIVFILWEGALKNPKREQQMDMKLMNQNNNQHGMVTLIVQ